LACALAACAHAGGNARAPQRAARAAATPAPWTADDREAARRALGRVFADPILAQAGLVVLPAHGAPLFARNAFVPMVPASSLKVVVAATALGTLGPAHRFTTTFESLATPGPDGTVAGPLFLVGGGDPILRSADLAAGVGVLAKAGIKRIAGDLIVDATAFAGPEQNAAWDPADLGQDYASGSSAISLDWDVAQFRVTPGAVGEAAAVTLVPPNRNVGFTGSIGTGYSTELGIDRLAAGAPERNEFAAHGQIAAGVAQSFYVPVLGIPWFAGGAVAEMLRARAIDLTGTVRAGSSPLGGVTLWTHRSPPLGALLHQMLVYSDNHVAEQLLHAVGAQGSHAGTDASGLHVEHVWLTRAGIGGGVDVADGSGLSPHDRIPSYVLASVVARAIDGRDGPVFLHALPVVGIEGTVRYHRLHAALGRARAKSGHIEGVNALVGTLETRRHGRVTFAFVVNDPRCNADAVTLAQDGALDSLANL
jgi:serine-type D-Ala-D-Ala carboxypeptidase/endopeptidase (penicillin-binding protein 4)